MPKRILVVDDEEDIVAILKARLENAGYEVDVAYDGKQGLEKIRERKPDLAIFDIMMPEINGSTLCGMLKFDERFKDIAIIILTAKGRELDKEISHTVGADAYMVKPFETQVLLDTVAHLLTGADDRGGVIQ
ncbi:MAG: response regulator [Candidatus Omnitrophota bacterium]